MPNYITYNRADDYAFCTSCKQTFSPKDLIGKVKSGAEGECPKCGAKIKYKSSRRLPKEHSDYWQAVFFQKMGDSIVTRIYDVKRDYSNDFLTSKTYTNEVIREHHRGIGVIEVYSHPYGDNWHSCNLCQRANYQHYEGEPITHIWYSHDDNKYTFKIYKDNLDEVFKGTPYEYSMVKEIFNLFPPTFQRDIDDYLELYDKTYIYEYLFKMGFYNLIKKFLKGNYVPPRLNIDIGQTKLHDMLCITRQQLKDLVELGDPTPIQVACMQNGFSLEDTKNISEFMIDNTNLNSYKEYFKFSSHKFRRYFIEHGLTNADINFYFDYLKMCADLGYDLRNEFVVFPKYLEREHAQVVRETNRRRDEVRLAQSIKNKEERDRLISDYAKRADDLLKAYQFEKDNLTIVVPKSTNEISVEGQKLHHCVGTYIEKVVKNQSTILFIRKLEEVEKPYFTLEIVDNNITQVYGYADCIPNKNIVSFVNKFIKAKELTTTFKYLKEA